MPRSWSVIVVSFLLGFSASFASAVQYGASLNHAEWRLQLSPFECRMWQPIPTFGDAVFSNRAGEQQRFYLAPVRSVMKEGKAQLISKAPLWDESRASLDMGEVAVRSSGNQVELGRQRAYQLLNELYDGMAPVFSRQAWYTGDETVEVHLSSINFRKAYNQYRDCLASLLPVNFEQIQRSRVHFRLGDHQITASSKRTLEHIIQYVKADSSVTGFYIDGHTDSVGRRLANLDLSQRRAESVTSYLVANGVDAANITTRYHGERYPVVNNSTPQNRAQNRRVTIRLEREGMSLISE